MLDARGINSSAFTCKVEASEGLTGAGYTSNETNSLLAGRPSPIDNLADGFGGGPKIVGTGFRASDLADCVTSVERLAGFNNGWCWSVTGGQPDIVVNHGTAP